MLQSEMNTPKLHVLWHSHADATTRQQSVYLKCRAGDKARTEAGFEDAQRSLRRILARCRGTNRAVTMQGAGYQPQTCR